MKLQVTSTTEIECGEKTCASTVVRDVPRFCSQVYGMRFGTQFVCRLFDAELKDDAGIPSGPGWLQRLPECLAQAKAIQ